MSGLSAERWSRFDEVPRPYWRGDFTTRDWSQYDGRPTHRPDGDPADFALLATARGPAFRALVRSRDRSAVAGESGQRTLLTLWPSEDGGRSGKTHAFQDADAWYRDDIYFPPGFQPTRDTVWNWLYEIHNFPDGPCCANLALAVVTDSEDGGPHGGARLSVRVMGGGSPAHPIDGGTGRAQDNPDALVRWLRGPELQTSRWYQFVWHVHWDWRPNSAGGQGRMEYWLDGRLIGRYSGPTLFYYRSLSGPGQGYLTNGFYRPDDATAGYAQPTVSVYHASTLIGPSAASVGANLG